MLLYLIRHGQTASNVNRLLDTAHPGAPLTVEGHAQAETLAARLAAQPIEAVYSSDLTRAAQTAAPLAGRLGLGVRQLPGLREIPAGVEEMSTDWTTYIDMLFRWPHEPSFRLEGSEDATTFMARYDAAIQRISESHRVAAAVSHGAAMRVWVPFRASNMETPSQRRLANTDVVLLEGSFRIGWTVLSWADEALAP